MISPLYAGPSLTWTGCGITKKAFMKEIAVAYAQKTGVKIKLSGGGATRGVRAVAAGVSHLGGSCRQRLRSPLGMIHEDEKEARLIQVAWDALVAIAHPSNPVDNISLNDLKRIYQGHITSWKALGGPDKRIILTGRIGRNSGVGHMFRLLAFNDPLYEYDARFLKYKSTGPLEKKVERSHMALGMDGVSSARKRSVKILSIDGIPATQEAIASGHYPLFRPLYLVRHEKAGQPVHDLINYVLSPEGQAIIASQGTVTLQQGHRLQQLWKKQADALGIAMETH
ncbi:MAG: phosphate ABC transporter substrate-binding protein [Magnetococcales bacterium]|nr:phosphate ABC transporter substrate-binding protein [Magnetococcales bacterium]